LDFQLCDAELKAQVFLKKLTDALLKEINQVSAH